MAYNKICFGQSIFELPRRDTYADFTNLFIIPRNETISAIMALLEESTDFTELDVFNEPIKTEKDYTEIEQVKEVNIIEDDEEFLTYQIKLKKPQLAPQVAQNAANIDYIAVMADIELEG